MTLRELNQFRSQQVSSVTSKIGVYALCDVDRTVIYIGQTVSKGERGISGRARRHITSARSDTIANRQLDVWEVAYLWAWPMEDVASVNELEANLFNYYNRKSPLLNGKVLAAPPSFKAFKVPTYTETQVIPNEEIERRKDPRNRLSRQVFQIGQLLDWILNVKDTQDLRRTLNAHFERARRHYDAFIQSAAPDNDDSAE